MARIGGTFPILEGGERWRLSPCPVEDSRGGGPYGRAVPGAPWEVITPCTGGQDCVPVFALLMGSFSSPLGY